MAAKLNRYTPMNRGEVADLRGPIGALYALVSATQERVTLSLWPHSAADARLDPNYVQTRIVLDLDEAQAIAEALDVAITEARIARQQSGWNELVRTTAEARHVA